MRLSHLIFGLAALAFATPRPVHAEDVVVYVVIYFDVAPTAAAETAALVRQQAEASRKENGNSSFQAFAEIGRPNRFATLEAWRDKPAYEAHGAAASTTAYRDKLKPLLISGTGARLLSDFSVAPPAAQAGPETVFVLTHVDVPPPQKDQAIRKRWRQRRARTTAICGSMCCNRTTARTTSRSTRAGATAKPSMPASWRRTPRSSGRS